MCSNCDWDYEADDTEEEIMPQNDRSTRLQDRPKAFNPYRSGVHLKAVSEEEMEKRARLYQKQNRDFKRGWRQAHPRPFLLVPAVCFFLLATGILALGWWASR